ncbi:hypothetical protein WN943_022925 [Citrus x changshan-huyou]
MQDNNVWELVSLLSGAKHIGCKWIFKSKRDSNGNVERDKARLVAKGFTQKEGTGYKETFSLVSTKDSFRTIMALVAHFDLELHHMDIKTPFLNGDIDETIYIVQPENFVSGDPKNMVCKLTKSIYGLKQASRFSRNTVSRCNSSLLLITAVAISSLPLLVSRYRCACSSFTNLICRCCSSPSLRCRYHLLQPLSSTAATIVTYRVKIGLEKNSQIP